MARRSWRRSVAVGLALLTLATGCASIPDDSGVVTGPVVDDTIESGVNFLPEGPTEGADQERILQDFVAAATGPQRNYETARLFLSSGFESAWKPNQGVLIRQGSTLTSRTSETGLDYTITSSASVDATGMYSESLTARPQTLHFDFVKERGEWRISSAPQGIILSRGAFEQIFQSHALYYFDSSFTQLVPDLRWFPALPTLSTRIAQALVAGQADWLRQGATVSSFPEGTAVASVTTLNGVAAVDLSQEALSANGTDKQRMQLQLTRSLGNIPSIQTVQMTVNGLPVAVSDGWTELATRNPSVDARPLVLSHGEFGYATPGSVSQIDRLSSKVAGLDPVAVALSGTRELAAVLNPRGVWVVRSTEALPYVIDARANLIAPSVDTLNIVWSMQGSTGGDLRVYELNGEGSDVPTGIDAEASVTSFEVSRDGARVAFGLATNSGPRLIVSAVLRDAETGVPVALGVPIELPISAGEIIDLAWISELAVAVLSDDNDVTNTSVYTIGGRRDQRGSPGLATTIVGGNNGVDGMWVLTASGSVLTPRGSGWLASGMSADLLATQ